MREKWSMSSLLPLGPMAQRAAFVALVVSCSPALTAAGPPQTLLVQPDRLHFTETQGADPRSKPLSIKLAPVSKEWTATTNAPWLEVVPSSGSSTKTLAAVVDFRNLSIGKYYATIAITPVNGTPTIIPVDLTIKLHPVLRTYSVIELCKQHGSLTGILAGFALTVAILLLERHERDRGPEPVARSSIVSFFVAFAASLETAFNFAVIGAETENSVRLAVQLIPVVFGLSVCIAYLFMGIALALFEYRIAERMPFFVILLSFVALAFLGLNMAFSTLWSVAVWEEERVGSLTAHSPWFSYSLIFLGTIPAFIIALRILKSRKEPSTRRSRFYIPMATFSLLVVTATSVLASFIADAVPLWMQQDMRWVGGLTVVLYVLVSGSAAASLPCYERRPPSMPLVGVP